MNCAEPFETERLHLTPFAPEHMEPAYAFFQSEHGRWHGAGPDEGPGRVWRICATLMGHWQIHGFGSFALVEKVTGACIGGIGIFYPAGHTEREIGWSIYAREGEGFAAEAGRAIVNRYLGHFGWDTLVSYIDPDNKRSAALAERLDAAIDLDANKDHPGDLVYRHRLGGHV
ncbi:MAG: GNAT family N-acetyltransferase [Rhodobacteraceae bacterium]|nr:GNAT family N-acetyltransferase [Paracoccaceae bacterium]